MPTCCAANEMTVVVPPKAAAVGGALEGVGVHQAGGGKLLDMGVAVDAAGQHQLAARVDLAWRPGGRSRPIAAIVSPPMATSAGHVSVAVATVPPRITRS